MLTKYSSLLAIPFVALVACGGDDGPKPHPVQPDASNNPNPDTPPAATCAFTPTAIGGLMLGTDQAPAADMPGTGASNYQWFETIADGPNMGRKQLVIAARLPAQGANDTSTDALIIELLPNDAGVFVTNMATNFQTDPNAATAQADSYLLGDIVGQAATNLYWAKSGSITLTAAGPNTGLNGGITKGSVATTNYGEIDDQGAAVAGGCEPSLMGLTFTLKTTATSAAGKPTGSSSDPFSPENLKVLIARAHAMKAAAQQ